MAKSSIPYLYDRLIGHFIQDRLIIDQQPVFLTGHPSAQSPLAKRRSDDPRKADRFELFIGGVEVAHGYDELNDPFEQEVNFTNQLREHLITRDGELTGEVDLEYLEALQAGLPPTVGCGIGVDRLVMLLTGETNIRDVLLFPLRI